MIVGVWTIAPVASSMYEVSYGARWGVHNHGVKGLQPIPSSQLKDCEVQGLGL